MSGHKMMVGSQYVIHHLEEGHDVRIYWKVDTVGHLHLSHGSVEVYQTQGLEDGPTEEAVCMDCEMSLDVDTSLTADLEGVDA